MDLPEEGIDLKHAVSLNPNLYEVGEPQLLRFCFDLYLTLVGVQQAI